MKWTAISNGKNIEKRKTDLYPKVLKSSFMLPSYSTTHPSNKLFFAMVIFSKVNIDFHSKRYSYIIHNETISSQSKLSTCILCNFKKCFFCHFQCYRIFMFLNTDVFAMFGWFFTVENVVLFLDRNPFLGFSAFYNNMFFVVYMGW